MNDEESLSQEDSRHIPTAVQVDIWGSSENVRWRIRKKFQEGETTGFSMLGYSLKNGEIVVEPEEAKTISKIFEQYISGDGTHRIAKELNQLGMLTKRGNEWSAKAVGESLKNEKYCGDLLLQKSYVSDYLTKRQVRNKGEVAQYSVKDDHEGIVSHKVYDFAQALRQARGEKYYHGKGMETVLTGMIRCAICGKNYQRKTKASGVKWSCGTYVTKGKAFCPSKVIPEGTIFDVAAKVLGCGEFDGEKFSSNVRYIEALPGNILRFYMADGRTLEEAWHDRSRQESWSAEKRMRAREDGKKRWQGKM